MPYGKLSDSVFELDPKGNRKRLSVSDNKNDILHVEGGKPLNGAIKVRGAKKNFVSRPWSWPHCWPRAHPC